MDKGAHFYRADFQIHSPRDQRWAGGKRPSSDEERFEYACEFVKKCRLLGIQAVGITDHNDVEFVKYFQLAAQDNGPELVPLEPTVQSPIIFPGVELSLQIPCQVIILLDADADESIQYALLQTLGLTDIGHMNEPEGPEIKVLSFDAIEQLDDRLKANAQIRGRYIILPHVGRDGHKSLIREGFAPKYASIPCVGGYIEKNWEELDVGARHILQGKHREWGNKVIGVFQTSDYRGDVSREVGCHSTWVKMAEPTAEALRQACLAHESRISQVAPTIPTKYIYRIEVSDSTFMGHVDFELNPQFNALIGGRGTGKSTVLEYLRWAMQDQPVATTSDIESTDGVAHKRRLIQDTLVKIGGVVSVYWDVDGVPHVVRCDSGTNELTLQVGTGEATPVTGEYLRHLLPVRAYSQKQLSSVSIRTAELQRFIEQPIQDELEKVEAEIALVREELKSLYADILRRRALERQLRGLRTTLASVQGRVAKLEESLPKLSERSQKALAEHAARLHEKQAVEALQEDFAAGTEALAEAEKALSSLPRALDIDQDSPQRDLLQVVHSQGGNLFCDAAAGLTELRSRLAQGSDTVMDELNKWTAAHEVHMRAYEAAQQEASAHRAKMNQIKDLRDEEAQTRKSIAGLEQQLKGLPDAETKFGKMLNAWCDLHRTRGNLLERQCEDLGQKSAGDIRADLVRGADIEASMEKLGSSLKGAHILPDHWNALRSYLLASGSVVERWRELMLQLRPLAEAEIEDFPRGASPAPLAAWNLTDNQLRAVVERLEPSSWLEVALTSLKDLPKFFLHRGLIRNRF